MTNTVEKTLRDIESAFQDNAWSYSVNSDGIVHTSFHTEHGSIDVIIRIVTGEPEYHNSSIAQFTAQMPFTPPRTRIPELASFVACVNGFLKHASFAIDPLDGRVQFRREHIAIGGHIGVPAFTDIIYDYLGVMTSLVKPAIKVSHFDHPGLDTALETISLYNGETPRAAGFNIDGPENDDEEPSKDFDLADEEE
jgi:hypothetical protein